MGHFTCDKTDFLLLVCDGVSEGNFPNPEVTELVAQVLEETNDPGAAARAVCHKAVEMNSKDNISCMVVLFDGFQVYWCTNEISPLALSPHLSTSHNLTICAPFTPRY
jgi:serine/threonine protein phosphatase PrpC